MRPRRCLDCGRWHVSGDGDWHCDHEPCPHPPSRAARLLALAIGLAGAAGCLYLIVWSVTHA